MSNALKSLGLSGELKPVEVDTLISGKDCFSDIRSGAEAIHHGGIWSLFDRNELSSHRWLEKQWNARNCRRESY